MRRRSFRSRISVRSTAKKRTPVYVADFETTPNRDDCRVWAYAYADIESPEDVCYGNFIGDFLDVAFREHSIWYFHNLAFDGSFIVDYILKNGYTWASKPGKGQLGCLISGLGQWYSISVVTHEGVAVEFRDSLKKIPLPVAQIPKAFGLSERKGDLDYVAWRPVGHVMTAAEKEYIRLDVVIVAKALKQVLDSGMSSLTVASDSLRDYREMVGAKFFKTYFPVIAREIDDEIRKAYRGGFAYAAERYAKKVQGPGSVYDVNSLYPAMMRNKELPYGDPHVFSRKAPPNKLFVESITFTAKLKKNHIPCIQVKKSIWYHGSEYLSEISEPVTLTATNVDIALWREHYDLTIISHNGGYWFDKMRGMFDDYIDKWIMVKKTSTGGKRTIAKLHLNSLYGKFATKTEILSKFPVVEDGIVKLRYAEPEYRDPVYTPVACFVTAWARDTTIRAAQKHYDKFLYADTDSLHLLGEEAPDDLWVHDTELGAWKCEGVFDRGVYVRAKQYAEDMRDGSHSVHIAGLPYRVGKDLTAEDLLHTREFGGKLVPERVPGGVILTETVFTLTV